MEHCSLLPLWRPDREGSTGFGRLCVVLFRVMRNRAAFGRPLYMPCKSACVLSYAAIGMPSLSEANLVPSTRDRIFWKAMSRATSGEPCFGLTSMLKGEKPQSSVEPSRSFGICFEARSRSSQTSCGVSIRGSCGLVTPMKHTCATPFASSLRYWPTSLQTRSLSFSLESCIRK